MNDGAGIVGATITSPFELVECTGSVIKICGSFFSDADGALLQPYVTDGLVYWTQIVFGAETCPEYLFGYALRVQAGGDGAEQVVPVGCLNGDVTTDCNFPPPPPSPLPPSPPPPSPPPPSPRPPRPPPPSPPPPSPPPPSPPPPSPPPPSPPPPSPPPPSPPPPSPPPPRPPPPSPPPPSPPPPPPPSPPPPPPPRPPPPPPPSPPPPPPPSPPPPPPPSPPPPPPPSPPPPPPPRPPPPPPPSPPPPSPPPPPPPSPPPPCTICAYVSLTNINSLFPVTITEAQCNTTAEAIAADVTAEADAVGAILLNEPAKISCSSNLIKVCGTFLSDAEGAKLQAWMETQVVFWQTLITGPAGCPAYLNGIQVGVAVGGDGGDAQPLNPPPSCVNALASTTCQPASVAFPKCKCVTKQGSTPFGAVPILSRQPGRKSSTVLYCFDIAQVPVRNLNSPCGRTASLLKAEIWADDNQRRAAVGVAIQPAGGDMRYLSATWGAVGEQTLKATPLNWGLGEADGAKVCIELERSTDLASFCNNIASPVPTCWINFFDDTKNCCPLYTASFVPGLSN